MKKSRPAKSGRGILEKKMADEGRCFRLQFGFGGKLEAKVHLFEHIFPKQDK